MLRNNRIAVILTLSGLFAGGCASNTARDVVHDFADGMGSNFELRQENQRSRLVREVDEAPRGVDMAAGAVNVIFQSVVRYFESDD